MKRFCRAGPLVFLGLWALLLVTARSLLFWDPGTFWHTAVGQQLLATRHFLSRDPYSFTFSGQPWIAHEWLGEVCMALVYGLGGWDGLLLITAAALAGLYAWLFGRLRRAGLHILLALFLVALALAAGSAHFHVRPTTISFLLFAFTYARLSAFEAGRLPLRQLFWLWPVFILWANCHGAVLGGLGTLFLAIAGWTLYRLLGWESPLKEGRDFLRLGVLFLGACLSVLLNPYGLELPKTWLAIMDSPVVAQLMQEHQPLLQSPFGWLTILFALIYLACLLGILPQRPRPTWLLPLVWLALAFSRDRHAPFFAVAAAISLAQIFPQVRWAQWLAAHGSDTLRLQPVDQGRLSLSQLVVPVALALLLILGGQAAIKRSGQGLARLDPGHWPVDLLPALKDYAAAHADGTPIFNDMLFGGFLIFHTPRLRVFIDDRCELYGDAFLLDYVRGPGARLEDWARQYGFELALTTPDSLFDQYLHQASGWRPVQLSPAGNLYRKSDSLPPARPAAP